MGIAHTVTRERLFEPLRRRLGGNRTWLGYLASCPYCVSHWLAFVIVPLTGAYHVDVLPRGGGPATAVLRWFFSSVLVAILAAFFRVIFYFVDETQGLVRRQQRTAEEEAAARRALRQRLEASTEDKVAAERTDEAPTPTDERARTTADMQDQAH